MACVLSSTLACIVSCPSCWNPHNQVVDFPLLAACGDLSGIHVAVEPAANAIYCRVGVLRFEQRLTVHKLVAASAERTHRLSGLAQGILLRFADGLHNSRQRRMLRLAGAKRQLAKSAQKVLLDFGGITGNKLLFWENRSVFFPLRWWQRH
jgi:hypothetical protein